MQLPAALKVGGHVISVCLVYDLPEDLDGEYDNEKLLIRINAKLPQSMREATLIHEIFHALNATFDNENHALMDSLAEQWYAVLKHNHLLREDTPLRH